MYPNLGSIITQMQSISNTVYNNYLARLDELTPQKMFHFVNRLSNWTSNQEALAVLQRFAPDHSDTDSILSELLTRQAIDDSTINLYDLRSPYFAKYSWLYGLELALFQIRHWLLEYGVDTRYFLRDNANFTFWESGINQLQADGQACATLSTFAVNCIYLWHRLIKEDELIIFTADEPAYFNAEPVLALYFSTHCCIAETLFYSRAIPADKLALCRSLVSGIENLAKTHFDDLSLDVLLEKVIAEQLCGIESPLHEAIIARANSHFDPAFGYITDPSKPDKNDLNGAEHRNTLYIMATTPPRKDLVTYAASSPARM